MKYIIGTDTGGTFTDCVVIDEQGRVFNDKAPSTPRDFAVGTVNSAANAAGVAGLELTPLLTDTLLFGHGTTVAANALVTRNGSKVGLITTKGIEDTIIIGRILQKVAGLGETEITNLPRLDKAIPIVPRPLIKGVSERVDFRGKVLVPLNRAEAVAAIDQLAAEGVEAIAVCFLWSFLNSRHEQEIKDLCLSRHPGMFVSISSELAPVMKEYERSATTAINAYLGKVTSTYLGSLDGKLRENDFKHSLMVMQSMGGFGTSQEVSRRAVGLLNSGPAGGVIASRSLGKLLGHPNIITTDVGGTTFDVGLIVNGEAEFARAPVFSQYHILIPTIDVISIGAGGGSLAWIEETEKKLKVGPKSAGAEPGPVCYDQGGTIPTVTDADVILGRIDPDYFLGGRIKLDKAKAISAMEEKIAGPLGMTVEEAAMGVVDIIDAHMADLVRKVSVGRGYDPRNFVLYAFGGGGPTHVGAYGRDVGSRTAVVPALAAVFSAFGIAAADILRIKQVSDPMIMPVDVDKLNRIYAAMEDELIEGYSRDGWKAESVELVRSMDMRYGGQVHEVRTPVSRKTLDTDTLNSIVKEFESRYEQKFGKGTAIKQAGMQTITYRVTGAVKTAAPSLAKSKTGSEDPSAAVVGLRNVYFKEYRGFHETTVYDIGKLNAGGAVSGPAIVQAIDTTVVIHPGQKARMDDYRNLVMDL